MLFAGHRARGKTTAAEILAAEPGLDLYRIDLAGVVSKWIGETEKDLDRVVRAAEGSNAIFPSATDAAADARCGRPAGVADGGAYAVCPASSTPR